MTDLEKYLNFKLITSIVNSEEVIKKLDSYGSIILTKDFIFSMNLFSKRYIDENKLSKEQVVRFCLLMDYVKNNYKLNGEELNFFNDMIVGVNQTDYSCRSEYCVENYIARFKGHNYYKIFYSPFLVPEIISKIKDSASRDYFFLMALTELDEKIFEEALQLMILDEYFLLSINQIIHEFPKILDNDIFVNRLRRVLDKNLDEISKVEDEKIRKIIYKESKFYYKHTKEE